MSNSKSTKQIPRVVMILDKSGSMRIQKEDVIKGVNDTISAQKKASDALQLDVEFTLVTFSGKTEIKTIYKNRKISQVPEFTEKSYSPGGRTALYQAICTTLKSMKDEKGVLCIIVTDGKEEGSSEKYTKSRCGDMIDTFKSEKDWKFQYVCEDIDQFKEGSTLGLNDGNQSKAVKVEKGGAGGYMSSKKAKVDLNSYISSYSSYN